MTGSLLQPVKRLVWLLTAHVYPAPLSEIKNPTVGLATTLIQGAGGKIGLGFVERPGWPFWELKPECGSKARMRTQYSRPSALNPPSPLSNCKPGGRQTGSSLQCPGGCS